jgi:hypothetical protein
MPIPAAIAETVGRWELGKRGNSRAAFSAARLGCFLCHMLADDRLPQVSIHANL